MSASAAILTSGVPPYATAALAESIKVYREMLMQEEAQQAEGAQPLRQQQQQRRHLQQPFSLVAAEQQRSGSASSSSSRRSTGAGSPRQMTQSYGGVGTATRRRPPSASSVSRSDRARVLHHRRPQSLVSLAPPAAAAAVVPNPNVFPQQEQKSMPRGEGTEKRTAATPHTLPTILPAPQVTRAAVSGHLLAADDAILAVAEDRQAADLSSQGSTRFRRREERVAAVEQVMNEERAARSKLREQLARLALLSDKLTRY